MNVRAVLALHVAALEEQRDVGQWRFHEIGMFRFEIVLDAPDQLQVGLFT